MLEYRENINYMKPGNGSLDQELAELNQLCSAGIDDWELYQKIRSYIFKEIKIRQLAVTKILQDLTILRQCHPLTANIITFFIIHNDWSYQDIADNFGCSRQYIHQLIKKYSGDYVWLENLMKIKGDEDSKNENNRSIFFNKPIQLSIILKDGEE